MPRVIAASEWAELERGVTQRVQALEMFLHDVYGEQHILRDRVALATKFGVRVENGKTFYDNSRAYIEQALHASLRRLETDHIDLYQIHYLDGVTPVDDMMEALLPRHMQIIYEINARFMRQVATLYPLDTDRQARMSIIGEGDGVTEVARAVGVQHLQPQGGLMRVRVLHPDGDRAERVGDARGKRETGGRLRGGGGADVPAQTVASHARAVEDRGLPGGEVEAIIRSARGAEVAGILTGGEQPSVLSIAGSGESCRRVNERGGDADPDEKRPDQGTMLGRSHDLMSASAPCPPCARSAPLDHR